MNLLSAYSQLSNIGLSYFTTQDASCLLKVNPVHASKILSRISEQGLIFSLKRGKWCLGDQIDPLELAEFLVSPFPSYISLQTALYYHGMISQIPQTIYVVSLARTHTVQNSFGKYSFHHVKADFFYGFELTGKKKIKVATPEKALLDLYYLSATKLSLFKNHPEVEIPKSFSWKVVFQMAKKISNLRMKNIVIKKLEKLKN